MSEEHEFKSDIAIDVDALDYEWTRQASLAQKYGELVANAILDRDRKKDQLAIKRAEIDLDIRENWTDWGFPSKPTENGISNAILSNEDIQKLQDELHELNYEVNSLTSIRGAFDHKRSALENLSKLYLAGYWGEARIPTEARNRYAEHGKEEMLNQLEQNERLKRRMKNGEKD